MILIRKLLLLWIFLLPLPLFPWENREGGVLLTAQKENVPIAAVFLGGKWCPWSEKLRAEVLNHPLFLSTLGKEVLVWEIVLEKEKGDLAMLQKYRVEQCPHIVLLDPQGKEFARLQSPLFDPVMDGAAILDLVESFHAVCVALGEKHFEESYWQELYSKAQKLSVPYFKEEIVKLGLEKEKGTFFHLEKLALLLGKHKLKSPQVLKIKRELIKRDPKNKMGTHFKIAALEFQKRASRFKSDRLFHKALTPLLQYVGKFGKQDRENLWRAQWMIAEFLYAKHVLPQALQYARAALEAAPEGAQPKLLESISLMRGEQ